MKQKRNLAKKHQLPCGCYVQRREFGIPQRCDYHQTLLRGLPDAEQHMELCLDMLDCYAEELSGRGSE